MKKFRNKEKRCTIFNKQDPRYENNGDFFMFLFPEKSGKDPDYYCDDKNDNKNSDTHSGLKNVSY
jgi:hypothetical protein